MLNNISMNNMNLNSPRNFTTTPQIKGSGMSSSLSILESEQQNLNRIQQLEQIIMEQQQIIQQQQLNGTSKINTHTNSDTNSNQDIQEHEIEESKTETKDSSKSNKTTMNRKSIAPSSLRKKNQTDTESDSDDDDQSDGNTSTKSKTKQNNNNNNNKKGTMAGNIRKSMAPSSLRKKQGTETESSEENETDSEDEKASKSKANSKTNNRASIAPIKSPIGAKKRVTMAPTTAKKNTKTKGNNNIDTDDDDEDNSSDNEKSSVKGKKSVSIKDSNKKKKKMNSNDDSNGSTDDDDDNNNTNNKVQIEGQGQGQGLLNTPDIRGLSLHDHPNYMNSNEANFQYEQKQFLEYQQQQEMLKTRSNRSNSYPSSQYDQSLLSRELMHAVAEKFRAFAAFGERVDVSIDSFKFVKLLSDAKLIDSRLNKQRADLIFYQSKAKGSKKMTYDEFRLKAIPYIAMTKGLPDVKIFEKIAECDGPKINTSSATEALLNSHATGRDGTTGNGNEKSLSRFNNIGNNSMSQPVVGVHHKNLSRSMGYNTSNNFNRMTNNNKHTHFSNTMPYAQNTQYVKSKQSIFERLNDPKTFTGVYAKRFEQSEMKGRINDDTINYDEARQYSGWTNTKKTDQKVDDLSQILIRR